MKTFLSSVRRNVKMFFKEKKDAQAFCKELNRRFQYCVDRGDFN